MRAGDGDQGDEDKIDRVPEDPVKGHEGGDKCDPPPENEGAGQGHERERNEELAANLPGQDRHGRDAAQVGQAAEEAPRTPGEDDVPAKLQPLCVRVDQHRLP